MQTPFMISVKTIAIKDVNLGEKSLFRNRSEKLKRNFIKQSSNKKMCDDYIILFNKQRSALFKYINVKLHDYPYQYEDEWYVMLCKMMGDEKDPTVGLNTYRIRCNLYHDIDEKFGYEALYNDLDEEYKIRVKKDGGFRFSESSDSGPVSPVSQLEDPPITMMEQLLEAEKNGVLGAELEKFIELTSEDRQVAETMIKNLAKHIAIC